MKIVFSLVLYPETELYNKAVQQGIITDDLEDVYRRSYNVCADRTSGKLLNETYFNNLFYLLYIFKMNGQDISIKAMSVLTDRKLKPLKSRLLYFWLRQKAGFLLKRNLIREITKSIKKGDMDRVQRWFHDEYSRD